MESFVFGFDFLFAGAEEGLEREGGREVRESTSRNERKW